MTKSNEKYDDLSIVARQHSIVLATVVNGNVQLGVVSCVNEVVSEITHWIPFPDPPEGFE